MAGLDNVTMLALHCLRGT